MESLKLESTGTTPEVHLNAENGVFEIAGISDEQDALGFYYPVIQWLDTYLNHPLEETTLNLRLKYFNTASSKALFELFKRLNELKKKGKKVTANWYYPAGDDSIKEDIEYFTDLTSLPINVVPQNITS